MKYIFIEKEAVKTLIDERIYQSIEFANAIELVQFLKSGQPTSFSKLQFIVYKEIGYIFNSSKIDLKNAIIFDLNLFTAFSTKTEDQIINIFQKSLRFAKKYWDKLPFGASEKILEDGHGVIFPLPFTGGNSYRVLINLCPDKKFSEKKGVNYIAISGDGYDILNDISLNIPFKRIRDEASQVCAVNASNSALCPTTITGLDVSQMDLRDNQNIDPSIGFDNWLYLLTDNQRSFIEKDIVGAERLEGAAGTGKTLTLILRAIYNIKKCIEQDHSCNMIFFAHSEATRKQIENVFFYNYPEIASLQDRHHSKVSLEITTLQKWCTKTLGGRILPSELLDVDAQSSKELQLMFLDETFEECMSKDFESYKLFCSEKFIAFFNTNDKEIILQMIQAEIAVSIKGRAGQELERYRTLERLEDSIPMENEGDYNFVYLIYEKYQSRLLAAGSFDSDDIVLSALGQLATPLWRRRKNSEGYNIIFIDETHLFNHNELSIFHALFKDGLLNMIFAIDKTQAIGDRGFNNNSIDVNLNIGNKVGVNTKYQTVFRSSPSIVNCAFHILSSGTTLFTTFENPLDHVNYSFTAEEEKKSLPPTYYLKENDEAIIKDAFKLAESYCSTYSITRHNILIVATHHNLLSDLKKYANKSNKPYECLTQRGDTEVIKSAESKNRFVIGLIDFVGGLEFDAVIVIGVDKDRVPPVSAGKEGYTFQLYAWHNRMYVAVSRAKYILTFIGDKSRGESQILKEAIKNEIIEVKME